MQRRNIGLLILFALLMIQCKGGEIGVAVGSDVLPPTPEYGDSTQWYITHRDASADIFYIVSTETGDYTLADSTVCHYADTYTDSIRGGMLGEMKGVDRLISGNLNFVAPFYRQCTLQSYVNDSTARARMTVPTLDVKRAFKHYIENICGGRPFVLAGYSQGAVIALDLLREMADSTYSHMVAAYIIGANISAEMLRDNPRIVPATGANDTGVTICYNSVRDTSCVMPILGKGVVGINPVNWRIDATPATLITVPNPHVLGVEQQPDTLTVTLDTESHLVLVKGYRGKGYEIPLIGREGNYHSREIWLYRESLRKNIEKRVAAHKKIITFATDNH